MFRTHTGEIVSGQRLTDALNTVADDWAEMSRKIRQQDHYAAHVTEEQKDHYLDKGLQFSEEIRAGKTTGFTTWQRINTKLTGECVGLFS